MDDPSPMYVDELNYWENGTKLVVVPTSMFQPQKLEWDKTLCNSICQLLKVKLSHTVTYTVEECTISQLLDKT